MSRDIEYVDYHTPYRNAWVGDREKVSSPGKTGDQDKLRVDVVPWPALQEIIACLTEGAKARAPMGWRQTTNGVTRYSGAAFRHFLDFMTGVTKDKDSGRHPLVHLGANAIILIDLVCMGNARKD